MRPGLAALALLAVALAAIVTAELRSDPGQVDGATPARPAATAAEATILPPSDRTAAIATLLARPLFSGTRRPPNVATPSAPTPATAAAPLPRMTGIVIDGPRRSVIFAGAAGGKPVVVPEGGRVGLYTVRSVAPQAVVVVGPDGARTVHTSFDPNRPAPSSPFVVPGAMPGFPAPVPVQVPVQVPVTTPGGRLPAGNTPFFLPPTPQGGGNGAAR